MVETPSAGGTASGTPWELPDFGLWHLTLVDASELIALDMWAEGEISLSYEPEDWTLNERDPNLLAALAEPIESFRAKLIAAINAGSLKAGAVRRRFDESIVPELTYVQYEDLVAWLEVRGYSVGDVFNEWRETTEGIGSEMYGHLEYLQAARIHGKDAIPRSFLYIVYDERDLDVADSRRLLATAKALVVENRELKQRISGLSAPEPSDRPLTQRARRTLLTIIAALCDHAGVDPMARGSSRRIAEMTERIGAAVTDETIAKRLAEIPDAVATRTK